jgi:phosphohistidine phosphatase
VRVFVIRHGEAGTPIEDDKFGADLKRPLSPEGRDQVAALAKWMKANDAVPTVLYHSPATRTRQTAQILGEALGVKAVADDTVAYGKSLRGLVKKVVADDKAKRVAIVSHHDVIRTGMRALNFVDGGRVDPIAKAEFRELKINRDNGSWTEKQRVLPSDLNPDAADEYL